MGSLEARVGLDMLLIGTKAVCELKSRRGKGNDALW